MLIRSDLTQRYVIHRMYVLLTIVLVFTVRLSRQDGHNLCSTTQHSSTPASPTFPPIKDQYFARVDWREVQASRSVYMEIYYDEQGQRSASRVTGFYDEGATVTVIADYNHLVMYTIDAHGCTKQNMSSGDEFVFQHRSYTNGSGSLLNAHYGLGLKGNFSYIGDDNIRDIPVDHWQSCYYDGGTVTTTWLDIYFAKPGWTSASGSSAVPIRKKIRQTIGAYTTENNYDYIYFMESLPGDTSIFALPKLLSCMAQQQTTNQTLPKLPKNFSFKLETTILGQSVTKYSSEWVDADAGLVRIDSRDIYPSGNGYSRRKIIDVTEGVSYFMDIDRLSCDVRALPYPHETFGLDETLIQNAEQFFNFSGNLQYKTQATVRDIPVSVWSETRTSDLGNHQNQTTKWTWYLSQVSWNMSTPAGLVTHVPVKVVVTGAMPNQSVEYNIYDFREKKPDVSLFDVSMCYGGGDIRYVRFKMTGKYSSVVAQSPRTMYQRLSSYLQEQFKLRPMKIQQLNILYDDTGALVSFVLLGTPSTFDSQAELNRTDEMVKNLTSLIDSSRFVVRFPIHAAQTLQATYVAVRYSLIVTMRNRHGEIVDVTKSPPTYTSLQPVVTQSPTMTSTIGCVTVRSSTLADYDTPNQLTGLAPGPVAGIAIGMVVLGFIIGVGLAALFFMQRSKHLADNDGMDHQLTPRDIEDS